MREAKEMADRINARHAEYEYLDPKGRTVELGVDNERERDTQYGYVYAKLADFTGYGDASLDATRNLAEEMEKRLPDP